MEVENVYECYVRTSPTEVTLMREVETEREAQELLHGLGGGAYRRTNWVTKLRVVDEQGRVL